MVRRYQRRFLKREQAVRPPPGVLELPPVGRLDVNGVESLLSMLGVKADRIYDTVSAGKRVHD